MKTLTIYWFGFLSALGSTLPWIYWYSYQSPENVREACFGAIVGALLACAISSVIVCWLERRDRKWADKNAKYRDKHDKRNGITIDIRESFEEWYEGACTNNSFPGSKTE